MSGGMRASAPSVIMWWQAIQRTAWLWSTLTGDKGSVVTVSERFITLRALMTGVPAEAGLSIAGAQECPTCPHDYWEHRLHPLDEAKIVAGGMTSCPHCDCAGTFSFNHSYACACGVVFGEQLDFEAHLRNCDQLPDGSE